MATPSDTANAILRDPEILGGRPCFAGTRVPVRNLFDLLMRGRSLEEFLSAFPTVRREQAVAVLAEAAAALDVQPINEPPGAAPPAHAVRAGR
jgi:uncharacterized protein (DUF433 family)